MFLKGRKNMVGVEIGSESGVNALSILQNLDISVLYLIDVYDTYIDDRYIDPIGHGVLCSSEVGRSCYSSALNNLKGYESKIIWRVGKSSEVAKDINEPLDFVYIDGNHRYEYVKEDIEVYYPKIKLGGVIGGHDFKSGEPGVVKAVLENFSNKLNNRGWDWWYIKE
jgi:hypothetical protein